MRRYFILFVIFIGFSSISSESSIAQRAIAAKSLVLDDGNGNTLTVEYPNIPPVPGNSIFEFLPGGGSSIPGGTANGQTLWWNNTTSLWAADNFLTNTGSAIGIGTSSPGSPLDLEHTFTQTTAQIGLNASVKIQPSATTVVRYEALQGFADLENANQIVGNYVEGVHGQTSVGEYGAATQPVSYIVGTVGQSSNYSTQTVLEADGTFGEIDNTTTGTISYANAFTVGMYNTGTGILTNASGLFVYNPENTGTITNLYGIYMNPLTAGTHNWPIFLSDGTLTGSIFNIDNSGNTTANSLLVTSGNISAPSAAVGTALVLSSGNSTGANSGASAYLDGGNASGTGNGGQSSVNGGNGVNGGDTYLHGGAGSSTGSGGYAHVWGGNGGSGGLAEVVAGSATSSNNYGGNTNIQAGTGFGNGFGGSVFLVAGPGGSTGAGGGIYFSTSPSNASPVTVMGITNYGTLQVGSANQFQVDKFGNETDASLLVTSGSISAPTSVASTGTDLALNAGGSGGTNSGANAYLAGGNANGTGNGGQSSVNGGNGVNGGDTYLHGGAGSSTGTGGYAHVLGGNGGSGGLAEVIAGNATSSNNYGGNTNIQAGTGFGNGYGGSIFLVAGPGGSTGAGGGIYFSTSSSNASPMTVMGITNSGMLQVGSANQFTVDNSGNETDASLSVTGGNISSPSSGTGAGTPLSLTAGSGASGYIGGNASLAAGTGGSNGGVFAGGAGGSTTIAAGTGGIGSVVGGNGGNAIIQGGQGGAPNGLGGSIMLQTNNGVAAPTTRMTITNGGVVEIGSTNQFTVDQSGNTTTSGNVSTGGHIVTTSTIGTNVTYTGNVISASVAGSDVAGVITFSTGGGSTQSSITVNFGTTYGTAPVVIVMPANAAASTEWGSGIEAVHEFPYVTCTASNFVVNFYDAATTTGGTLNYIVVH